MQHEDLVIQSVFNDLGTIPRDLERGLKDFEITGMVRPSKLKHKYRPKYWKESWRLDGSCWHSDSSKRQSPQADTKNSQGIE